ncbi:UPF0728 protein C10orf53 homolog [Gracilinanus agilis]|uniref:UPF0728 protein C10orf53 homolog n=1 Tax=Gracilinanus agilis TaxID=191870 RepID=UPI001CFCF81F|nr:UPF0728 protein C10orf53 homolog [Gracilinanus agilis]
MPMKALVYVLYGPYRMCKLTAQHRTFRLEGLLTVLRKDGHEIILQETEDWNCVELVVNGETVFQCKIDELDFGGDGKLDPLCEEARKAVLDAY